MTHRVYLRHPDQRVAHKTTTESREVAEYAYRLLCTRYNGEQAEATWTEDGGNQRYRELTD